ncbi:MAG: hypothetical protein DRQ40_06105 [Gammaproteobacteria bacterium]|nr:MAG: hypothetical protein DRQ40_06105 [Gammaproteobacteria bacterium]
MPRIFSTSIQGELDKQFAGEPMVIIEVNWSGDSFVAYSDRKLNGEDYPYPDLINIGVFDTTKNISGGSSSQEVSITLNDIDGAIRSIVDTQDIHLRPVRVYLTFQGLSISEKALMFEGLINSTIEWDESGRTLSFSVLSKLEDAEAGFTMEDGDFPQVEPSDANVPWPLVFGQVCNMKAERVTSLRKGYLAQSVGVMDPTIDERLCQANHLICTVKTSTVTPPRSDEDEELYQIKVNDYANSEAMQLLAKCCNGDLTRYDASLAKFKKALDLSGNVRSLELDQQCLTRRFTEICKILQERSQQSKYVRNPFTVRGGEDFPQNERIIIRIGEVKFDGIMTGESFLVSGINHPDSETIDNPPCKPIKEGSLGFRYGPGPELPTTIEECENGGGTFRQNVVDGGGASWKYYNEFEAGHFIWLPAGKDVFLEAESELIHLVSLLPGVVDQVAAYRTYGDTTLLTEVDPERYTVVTSDFDGYDVVQVVTTDLLSNIKDENWSDTIYVSFTSSVGPNPVDTISWLVEKYTDYTVDIDSFLSVKADLVNYPSNFFVKARPSVLSLIKDIAYQARCGIFIRDNVIHIVYLSKEPASLLTLTEDDILHKSFSFHHTTTEELMTRHEVKWSNGEAGVTQEDKTEFDFVIKHNIPKYGTFDTHKNYYTQNTYSTVEKSATFWMIRESNTWRKVKFSTPVRFLNLDVFDCVTLDIEQFPTTKVIIESTKYSVDNNIIEFIAWTPVLSGTSAPYYWAWPSQQAADSIFPLDGSQNESGDGFRFRVIPPEGHPLRGGYDPYAVVSGTDGDRYPSDLDDLFPNVVCPLATGAELAEDIEPIIRILEPLAEKNFEDKLDDQAAANLPTRGVTNKPGEESTICGVQGPARGGCTYEVTIFYITPELQQGGDGPDCGGGPCGKPIYGSSPCTGSISSMCHSFGALFAATMFLSQKKAEIRALQEGCGYDYMVTKPYADSWSNIKTIPGSGVYGACENIPSGGIPNPDAPGADAGETRKPAPNSGYPDVSSNLADNAQNAARDTNTGVVNNPYVT